MDPVRRGLMIALAAQAVSLAGVALIGCGEPAGIAAGGAYGALCDALIAIGLVRAGGRVGAANAATWTRAVLVGVVVALVAAPPGARTTASLVAVTTVALVLDGVDGRVARATGTVSSTGARFDMEVDASLVLVLSVAAVPRIGAWVLLVGAARYLLLIATVLVPRLAAPTPPRLWRKAVAVLQGVVLTIVCAGVLGAPAESALAFAAGLALAWSFVTQIHGLLSADRLATASPSDLADVAR